MINDDFEALQAIEKLGRIDHTLAVDTETTGLRAYQGDRLFSVIIGDNHEQFYFNFNPLTPKHLSADIFSSLATLFLNPYKKWVFHNAKFDLHFLAKEGIEINGHIFDNIFLERLYDNTHLKYGMEDMAKRWGYKKSSAVDDYIGEHKLIEKLTCPRTGEPITRKMYERVPEGIIEPYAKNDVAVTYNLFQDIMARLHAFGDPKIHGVIENESKLIKTVYKMEKAGVQVDLEYCQEAREWYEHELRTAEHDFFTSTGKKFKKSGKVFEEIFQNERDKWTFTEKGNPEFNSQTFPKFENPASEIIQRWARAKKQHEYFTNFLYYADENGVIHPNLRPDSTKTNRFSCSDPNLQNLTKPDKYEKSGVTDAYAVRAALVPRLGHKLLCADFSQIEYRVMLDLSNASKLISEIIGGLDVHEATAKHSGCTRTQAKTVNFLSLYGGGVAKLALGLFKPKCSEEQLKALWKGINAWTLKPHEAAILGSIPEAWKIHDEPLLHQAKGIQDAIFKASPEIKQFISQVQKVGENRGYVRDFLGRRYKLPSRNLSYKLPNHLVQGSCATIMKIAMNRIQDFLESNDLKSRMILTVHDEIDFEIAKGEEHIIPEILRIMRDSYPHRELHMDVEAEISEKNLADKEEWKDAS